LKEGGSGSGSPAREGNDPGIKKVEGSSQSPRGREKFSKKGKEENGATRGGATAQGKGGGQGENPGLYEKTPMPELLARRRRENI